jgi:TrmH family RNA methyltransferase
VPDSTRPRASATKREVQRLRQLLRDKKARDAEGVFVLEGPRVVSAAVEHRVELLECYVGSDAYLALAERTGAPVKWLDAARVGDARTPQPFFALTRLLRAGLDDVTTDLAVVAGAVNDPGNAGTLIRGAAAAGAGAVIFGPGSVDAYNPKVVRASAGACFATRIVEAVSVVQVLDRLDMQRVGAVARGGQAPESFDFRRPTCFVLGHETRGLEPGLPLDARVTIPMRAGESLNLAMAATVLLFEAARQRRTA